MGVGSKEFRVANPPDASRSFCACNAQHGWGTIAALPTGPISQARRYTEFPVSAGLYWNAASWSSAGGTPASQMTPLPVLSFPPEFCSVKSVRQRFGGDKEALP